MSARAIWEATGKELINDHLNAPSSGFRKCRFAVFDENTKWEDLVQNEPWLESEVSCHIFLKH
jgi:ATP citrate (pro-S)-lyase